MQAYVSLWSADLLALGAAVDLLDGHVDGFHIDIFDGHNVPDLLFGPDLVAALRRRTVATIDVHLNTTDPDYWVDRFADAGADIITVQTAPCHDLRATLAHIRERGVRAGLGLETHEQLRHAVDHFDAVDRVLLLGTAIIVDGAIRKHTVPGLAQAGADGVVPGSLVFAEPDPRRAAAEIRALRPG